MSSVLAGTRHLGLVRWSARRRRRQPRGRRRATGRTDRAQRRGQDDVHRCRHRLRAASRHGPLDGEDITALTAARPGPGRSRPHLAGVELFDDLTVRENLAVAPATPTAASTRSCSTRGRAAPSASTRHSLSRRWSELADALPRPHAGSAQARDCRASPGGATEAVAASTCRRGSRRRRVRGARPRAAPAGDRGTPILLSTTTWDWSRDLRPFVVLEFGKVIAHGTPAEIRQTPGRPAYLGCAEEAMPPTRRRGQLSRARCSHGLTAGYDGAPVVRDLDLHVDAGEVVALLGPNGAGKTTTLRTISGSCVPAGTIRVDGDDLRRAARRPPAPGSASPTSPRAAASSSASPSPSTFGSAPRRRLDADIASILPAARRAGRRRAAAVGWRAADARPGPRSAGKPRLMMLDEMSLGPRAGNRQGPAPGRVAYAGESGCRCCSSSSTSSRAGSCRPGYVLSHGELVVDGRAEVLRGDHQLILSSYLGEQAHQIEAP